MNEEIIASRYAKAFFDMAVEQGNVEEMDGALDQVARATLGDEQLHEFWSSPVIERSEKRSVLDNVIRSAGIGGGLEAYLRLLVEKGRFHLLNYIARAFRELAREHLNRATVKLTTARPLSAEQLEKVRRGLQHKTGKTIEIAQEHDPGILGGIVVRIKNTIFDGSVRGRLQRLERELAG